MTVSTRIGLDSGVEKVAQVRALGFDPIRGVWTTSSAQPLSVALPEFDGELLTDAAACSAYADDFGHLVHHTPIAVLKPASVDDVVRAIRFCYEHEIKVAARGQSHSTAGQSQARGGLVIDMSTLNRVLEVGRAHVRVQAGLLWRDMLSALIPQGVRPPVVTSYTGLSVGGTLSMGGIGAASFLRGPQVGNVLELELVTGDGKLVTCSPTQNAMLFEAVLGGVGQYGIIVSAKLPLVEALPMARNYVIGYADSAGFFADMNRMIEDGRVDGVYGQLSPDAASGWVYLILAVKYYAEGVPPVDGEVLAGLGFPPPALQVADMPAFASDTFVDSGLEQLNRIGLYNIPHVWADAFLPASKVHAFVDESLRDFSAADLGPAGFVLLFPVANNLPRLRSLRLPDEPTVWLLDVLTSSVGSDPSYADTQIAKARALYERARAIGGTLYPIGSTPMTKSDWAQHYGRRYGVLSTVKSECDPARILTPGVEIF